MLQCSSREHCYIAVIKCSVIVQSWSEMVSMLLSHNLERLSGLLDSGFVITQRKVPLIPCITVFIPKANDIYIYAKL